MEAIAKHDFNATAEDELSFRKNQVLKVRQTWVTSYGCISPLHSIVTIVINTFYIQLEECISLI